ncbi:MAG: serine/threonine-protein kinase [Candidatus Eisenbacteria bacterium]|uniref:Serine/threonine protein kinase n=1 Tax=Eiseniibacteriota bacterium TaxID=2212470 RepID=A0A956LZZ6_UNCEI|nr:serine/threonine protein kinase [Candidatus Eisenbacteria bacterium]
MSFSFPEDDAWLDRLREVEQNLPLGTLGPYEVLREIGRGGQGVVYRARDPRSGKLVALKRLLGGALAGGSSLARLGREAQAGQELSHPGIVRIFGVETVEGHDMLVMEWIDGRPITDWARDRSDAEIVDMVLQVAAALQHAHRHGIVHRDIKPSNILVDETELAHVLDFGLAKQLESSSSQSRITTTGEFLGTLAYAAPEQLRGPEEELDHRVDQYSLGVILYEMLAGTLPYSSAGQLPTTLRAILFAEPPPLRTHRPEIADGLEAIVRKALAKEPAERYDSIAAMAADLERHSRGEPVRARPPGAGQVLGKLMRRHPIASGLLATAATITIMLAITMSILWVRAERAVARAERIRNVLESTLSGSWSSLEPGREAATDVLESAGKRAESELSGDPRIEFPIHNLLASRFADLQDWPHMEREAHLALAIQERLGPPWDEGYTISLNALGMARLYRGDSTAAEYFERAIAHHATLVGDDDIEIAVLRSSLARALWLACDPPRYVPALSQYQRALDLFEGAGPDSVYSSIPTLEGYSNLLSRLGRSTEAKAHLDRALLLLDDMPERWRPTRIRCHERAARLCELSSQPAEAEAHYRTAIELRRNAIDAGLPPSYSNLGRLLFLRGLTEDALRYYHEAIATRCEWLAARHPEHRPALLTAAAELRLHGLRAEDVAPVWCAIEQSDPTILPLFEVTASRIADAHHQQNHLRLEADIREQLTALNGSS